MSRVKKLEREIELLRQVLELEKQIADQRCRTPYTYYPWNVRPYYTTTSTDAALSADGFVSRSSTSTDGAPTN